MKVLIRTTLNGSEYWDTVAKKTLFVPEGAEPHFEVTENPKSMVVKLAEDKVIDVHVEDNTPLEKMNVEQLRAYAASHDIDVPGNIKKPESILKYINEQLVDDE